jgi:DNA-binding HxlR family transcriptional regulator
VLIVQEAFFGLREFDLLQRRLGIAPNILSNRLNRLSERGVLQRRSAPAASTRQIYYLTDKGLDLYPVPALLRQWAISTLGVEDPLHFSHRWCGSELAIDLRCTHCGAPVDAGSVDASIPPHLKSNHAEPSPSLHQRSV